MDTEDKDRDQFIEVAVSTTSGQFPDEGFKRTPLGQPVKVMLEMAARALGLIETESWVARVDDLEINPVQSYQDNGLSGEITIDWGPSEGGGGA